MSYRLLQHRQFAKEILRVPAHHQRKIYRLLSRLKQNPSKLPANTTPLRGFKGVYRTRVGNLRLIYQIDRSKKRILALGIGSRGGVYRIINRMLA